jgi:5'-phosphate synthase pdxT subunit
MLTLLRRRAMLPPLAAFGHSGRPVLATCAGLILAAHPELGWLDIGVRRNAYGSQLDSFVARSDDDVHELVFIRAPRIERVPEGVEVLARYRGEAVLVRQGTVVGATFHPELSPSTALHETLFPCG